MRGSEERGNTDRTAPEVAIAASNQERSSALKGTDLASKNVSRMLMQSKGPAYTSAGIIDNIKNYAKAIKDESQETQKLIKNLVSQFEAGNYYLINELLSTTLEDVLLMPARDFEVNGSQTVES